MMNFYAGIAYITYITYYLCKLFGDGYYAINIKEAVFIYKL